MVVFYFLFLWCSLSHGSLLVFTCIKLVLCYEITISFSREKALGLFSLKEDFNGKTLFYVKSYDSFVNLSRNALTLGSRFDF